MARYEVKMTKDGWKMVGPYKWQRHDDGLYETYVIIKTEDPIPHPYFAGGGTFALEKDEGELEHSLHEFGYEDMEALVAEYGDDAEDVLAGFFCECNLADWNTVRSFRTLPEARAYVGALMATAVLGREE
jgi:hypothetical protein